MPDEPSSLRAREILRRRAVDVLPDAARVSSAHENHEAFFGGLLEAAFLVAAADGTLSKEEVGSLIDVVSDLGGEGVTPSELAGMVYEFSSSMEKEGRQARLDALARAVTDAAARREILGFASLVALCDHDLAPSELFVLHSLGKAFGLDAAAVGGVINSVKAAMGEGAA